MNVQKISKLSIKDIAIAGGKGASLAEMLRMGTSVPSAFVVLSSAFDLFLSENSLLNKINDLLQNVKYDDNNSLNKASKAIKKHILGAKFSEILQNEIVAMFKEMNFELIAVRSSATAEDSLDASWAGELESYLNVCEKDLFENIKKCWSSLYTPRAIYYRKEQNLLNSKISVAVVIQEMINPEVSGITFTVNPVTKDKNQCIIEAGYGLGEAIVSGSITPDSYIVDKKSTTILSKNISTQNQEIIYCENEGIKWTSVVKEKQNIQKLNDEQILELTQICLKIEKHYRKPQDIEWALKDNKFYILQSRPITTL